MKYLFSAVITVLFYLTPIGLYLLARNLFKFEFESVSKVLESITLINLGIYLIMFFLIILFFINKEEFKKNNIHEGYKKLIFSLFLVYLVRILINPILFSKNSEVQANVTDTISLTLIGLNLLNLVIFPSINEELIFRGYILRKFINNKRELIGGMIFSSILFASIHIDFLKFNYSNIIYTFILGLFLGCIYIRFGIIISIICHAFINFIFYAKTYLNVDLIVVNYFNSGFVFWMIIAISSISLIVLFYKGVSDFQIKSPHAHR
jgi:uncharacterized protein